MFVHELLVGVECMWHRGCLARHARTSAWVWVAWLLTISGGLALVALPDVGLDVVAAPEGLDMTLGHPSMSDHRTVLHRVRLVAGFVSSVSTVLLRRSLITEHGLRSANWVNP